MGFSLSEILEIIDQSRAAGRSVSAGFKAAEIEGASAKRNKSWSGLKALRCGKGESMENDQVTVKSLPGVVLLPAQGNPKLRRAV